MAQKCHGDKPPANHAGLSFGAFRSRLIFTGAQLLDLEEAAVGFAFERRLSAKVTVQVSLGGIVYARIDGEPLRGLFVGGGASWAIVPQKGAIPFIMLALSIAASFAGPERGASQALYALDFRGSVTAGYTLGKRWTPYAVGRIFGGPVVLVDRADTRVGTDIYHFQLGAGLVVGLPGGFDLSAELIPLGEQRVSAGVGHSF